MVEGPLHILLAADMRRLDVAEALAMARVRGGRVRVLLVHEAVPAAAEHGLGAWGEEQAWSWSVCTRSARDAGLGIDSLPTQVAWTSVATWHLAAGEDPLWSLWP